MKLSETINYINSALNYPAISYVDIALFMDAAIAELNTALHISLPLVKDIISEFRQNMSKYEPNKIILTEDPEISNYVIKTFTAAPTDTGLKYYYRKDTRKFYILNEYNNEYAAYDIIKGIYNENGKVRMFQAIAYGNSAAWAELPISDTYEAELIHYLPNEWVILWLIPYVCYKYSARDGGTAQTFAEELNQGFQQLQESYNIPHTVNLATYADKEAYSQIVKDNLPNLNIEVPTRAIYDSMKHSRNTNAIFGSFYDRGGF